MHWDCACHEAQPHTRGSCERTAHGTPIGKCPNKDGAGNSNSKIKYYIVDLNFENMELVSEKYVYVKDE
jgi:hypothetical protein